MPWVKLDDAFFTNEAAMAAGPDGRLLFLAGLCHASRNLTDGAIDKRALPSIAALAGADPATADTLVELGLWVDEGSNYRAPNFLTFNPSREQVLAQREVAKRRSAMNTDPGLRTAIRDRDGDACRYCASTVNWKDRKGPLGGTYDHVVPVAAGGTEALENLVVACRSCNVRKGARTPEQAGMALHPAPTKHGPRQESKLPVPSPSPSETLSSSSTGSTTLPEGLWMKIAQKQAQTTSSTIGDVTAWCKTAARNAKSRHQERAEWIWATYQITESQLVDVILAGGSSPLLNSLRKRDAA